MSDLSKKDYKKEKEDVLLEEKYKHLLFYITTLQNFDFQYGGFYTNGDNYLLILNNEKSKNIKIYIFNDKMIFFYKKNNKLDFRFLFKNEKSLRKTYNDMISNDVIAKILQDEKVL